MIHIILFLTGKDFEIIINKDDFNEKVKNGIINIYYSSFDDSKYYDYLIDENLKTYENDTNKIFLYMIMEILIYLFL